ncbi:MAG TPA: cell division protein ZapA [bacterium]|nr:cell division protein ZapA [bacterium]
MARTHEVVLLGRKYKLRSPHDDAYLRALATYLTERIGEVQRKGTSSTLDAALLAALNIADDLFRVRKDAEERLAAIGEKTQGLLAALEEDESARDAGDAAADEALVDEPADAPDVSDDESAESPELATADVPAPATVPASENAIESIDELPKADAGRR